MSLETSRSDASAHTPADSPGRLIAAARESHAISPADLAVRLRLETKIIKALERDDFENLPAPTFIKGYIRSIANQLDVDAAPILEAYAAHTSAEPPALADFSSRAPEQIGINSTVVKVVTYTLGATLILLIALWWRSAYRDGDVSSVPAPGQDVTAVVRATEPLSYSYPIVEHDDKGWRVESSVDPTEAPEMIDQEIGAAPDAGDGLSITTTSEAWVEVYDAAGSRLYYGMAKAQDPVEIPAQAYYRLVLGNVESITLRLNGEDVDLEPHSHLGVAQLELGAVPPSEDRLQ